MRLNCSRLGLALSLFLVAVPTRSAHAQTDVALSVYGTFTGTTNYNGDLEHQKSADALGGIFELRHIRNPLIGYEATYSFNRANQVYTYTGGVPAGSEPGIHPDGVSANAHEISGVWIFSVRTGKLQPFALVGGGLMLTEPVSGQSQTKSSSEAVFVYGAGLDWRMVSHFGLRVQCRGNVYKAPAISTAYGSNTAFMHTAEPMIGAYVKF
jgi:opacity protein-like surface antigen